MSFVHLSARTQDFLAACGPEELNAMVRAIQSSNQGHHVDMTPSIPRPATTSRVTKRTKKHKQNPALAAKRPLNSFIAFRVYYGPIFASEQQKDISGHLKFLWKADVFHTKWALLAIAYSTIRDSCGKEFAPLNSFLSLTCPYIGIVAPNDYLTTTGWEVVVTEGVKTLTQSFLPHFPIAAITTNYSPADIVAFCYQSGYISQNNQQVSQAPSLVSFTAKPSNYQLSRQSSVSPSDSSGDSSLQPVNTFGYTSTSTFYDNSTPASTMSTLSQPSGQATFSYGSNGTPQINQGGNTNSAASTSAVNDFDFESPFTPYIDLLDPDRTDLPFYEPLGGNNFLAYDVHSIDELPEGVMVYTENTAPVHGNMANNVPSKDTMDNSIPSESAMDNSIPSEGMMYYGADELPLFGDAFFNIEDFSTDTVMH